MILEYFHIRMTFAAPNRTFWEDPSFTIFTFTPIVMTEENISLTSTVFKKIWMEFTAFYEIQIFAIKISSRDDAVAKPPASFLPPSVFGKRVDKFTSNFYS